MGHIKKEFVVATVSMAINDDKRAEAIKKLDDFVKDKPLFAKSEPVTNGFINYVMFWDGSYEGWDDSNDADDLRAQFIALLKMADAYGIYHVIDDEGRTSMEVM